EAIMRWFAPVSLGLGVHWHHFGNPILPPILDMGLQTQCGALNSVLVYLPFENTQHIIDLLKPFRDTTFILHCGDLSPGRYGNVTVRGFSREGFMSSLGDCGSVICNAGFQLVSEALVAGKRILVKPLHGQMEQSSNAAALDQLGLAQVMMNVNPEAIAYFLATGEPQRVTYPNVAEAIVDWLHQYPNRPVTDLVTQLWQDVQFSSPRAVQAA
ncbi:MAG: glycosyltransferase family protein, partial [Pseudohongiellaceae bacterium]